MFYRRFWKSLGNKKKINIKWNSRNVRKSSELLLFDEMKFIEKQQLKTSCFQNFTKFTFVDEILNKIESKLKIAIFHRFDIGIETWGDEM